MPCWLNGNIRFWVCSKGWWLHSWVQIPEGWEDKGWINEDAEIWPLLTAANDRMKMVLCSTRAAPGHGHPWSSMIFLLALCLVDPQSREQRKLEYRHWQFGVSPPQTVPVLHLTAQQVSMCQGRTIRDFCSLVWQKSHKTGQVQWPQSSCWVKVRPKAVKILNNCMDSCSLLLTHKADYTHFFYGNILDSEDTG